MKNKILLLIITFLATNALFSQTELKVGDNAPDITITDYILNTPTDKKFKNKFILLEFWATWCAPCLEGVPHLNKLQQKFKQNKDFVFISVTNEKPEKAVRTLKRIPFNSIVVSDQTGATFKHFIEDKQGSFSIPKTILIDNKGIVKWIGSPFELNDLILEKFINGIDLDSLDNTITNKPPPPGFVKQEEKITDIAYKTIYNEATQYSFTLLTGNKNDFKMNYNTLNKEGLYFDLNKDLISIISNLSGVLESQIILPEKLKEQNYSLFYKNKNFNTEKHLEQDIKKCILKTLHLKENIISKTEDVYFLKVKNKDKLEEIKNETEATNGQNSTHFLLSNVPINYTIKSMSLFYKIIIKDETNLHGNYDFILKNTSLEETIKDLESYGLTLVKAKDKVEFYKYE